MVERQRRPFGKDHNVLALQKTLVRLPHQFPEKCVFPLFRTTALPSRRPTTIPTRVFPRQDRQETTLKNCVVMRWPSRFTRSKSSFFFKNNGRAP